MTTVDIHTHFIPQAWLKILREKGEVDGVAYGTSPEGKEFVLIKKQEGGPTTEQRVPITPEQFDASKILADMDEKGIDRQVLSPMQFLFYYWTYPARGKELTSFINEATYRFTGEHPDRFIPMAILPMQDLEGATCELERVVKEMGMTAVEIGTNINGMELDDQRLAPFYKKIQELDVLLFVHPYDVVGMDRMKEYYLRNLAGNPFETSLAVSRIIFGGVLEEYPRLKFLFSHGGGTIPYIIGRMDHGYHHRAECQKKIVQNPSHYLRSLYFDTILFEKSALQFLVETIGPANIVLGTDYPFEMMESRPIFLINNLDHISNDEKNMIRGENALTLLKL